MRKQLSISNKQNRPIFDRRLSLNFNSACESKNPTRMSIPSKRESLAASLTNSQIMNYSNRDMKQHRHSFASMATVQIQKQPKKQTILKNLMYKLDHEQQLKQIIQSKIKNCKQTDQALNYCSQKNENTEIKLANCQEQLHCCKDLIRHLMQKIQDMERTDRKQSKTKVKLISTSIQTEPVNFQPNVSVDFIDNLDKTLKVLSGKKLK